MPKNKSSIHIRLAVPDDAGSIASVLYEAFAEYITAYAPAAFAATTPTPDQIRSRMDEGPVWVALHHNAIVGTVSAVPKGEELYIRSMAVLPTARGHGVGRRLLQHVEDFAAAQGCTSLFLSTTPFLAQAIRLYEQWGFRRSESGPHDLFGTPLVTMVKPLAPPPEPLLETPRLRLRSMRADDVDQLLSIFADPKVMAAFGVPPFDRAQMLQWVQRNLDHQAAHGYGLFSVILKASGALIGDCGLELMDVEGVEAAELGYDFRSDHWNQGYATEAAMAVRDYAFQQLCLPRLISLIRVGNLPSRRVAEKIGMRCTAEITRYGHRYWQYALEWQTVAEP